MDEGTIGDDDSRDGDGEHDRVAEIAARSRLSPTLPTTSNASDALPGDELDYGEDPTHIGRFMILRRVGEGGMGVVYAAYDNELDRRLAIKLVHVTRAQGDSQARIRREAQAMARLSHPNVVQVYEVGEHEQQVFVAMEFVVGPTLAAWTHAQPPSATRWRGILDRYIEAGRGLAAAHAAHLVHRDFKPANAIVGDDGRVRVLDFGIARAPQAGPEPEPRLEPEPSAATAMVNLGLDVTAAAIGDSHASAPLSAPLTSTGALVGTPAYMSPEQFERGSLDARSDQFSFCVALYRALYGERPFDGDSTNTLMFNVLNSKLRPAPPNAEVPTWVRELLVRGLVRDPAGRWPSMDALLVALGRDPERRRRRRRRQWALISVTLVVILGLGWFAQTQMRSAAQAEAARAQAQRKESHAEAERDRALLEAQASAVRASDTARVLAAGGLDGEAELAAALLRDVEHPDATPGWRTAAVNVLQHPLSARVLRGHADRVVYIDVSADGEWLASASFDGTVRLWPRDGGPPTVLAHDASVVTASFDPRGQLLVTAVADGTAAVWPVPTPTHDGTPAPAPQPTILRGHSMILWSARFSPDGTKVVSVSRDGSARVWSLDAPETPAVYSVTGDLVWWAEFSPDGRWFVTAAKNGNVSVWSVDRPERPPIVLEGHRVSVGDVHFDANMKLIVTASDDGSARLYRFDPDASVLRAHAVLKHDNAVHRARFSADGSRVVTVSRDQSAKLWTLDERGDLSSPPQVFPTDSGAAWSADFSPDGRFLAVGVGSGVVQIWPLEGGPVLALRGHSSEVFRVRYAPDGSRLYSASSDGTVRVWNTNWQQAARSLDGHQADVSALERRGELLVSGSTDGSVRVWPVADPGPAPAVSRRPTVMVGHSGRVVVSLDESPRLLATADDEHDHVRLWPITGTGVLDPERPLATVHTGAGALRSIELDGAGQLLAGAQVDGTVSLWSLTSGLESSSVPLRLGQHLREPVTMTTVKFSPDGQKLASAGGDMIVNLWDRATLLSGLASGQAPAPTQLLGHTSRVYNISFSPDGSRLASVSTDYSARVWTVAEPQADPLVLEHGYNVVDARFDPTGRRLVTACADTKAYLWDLDDPGEPRPLSGAAAATRAVEFSPDGRQVGAVFVDGSLRVWPTEGGEPIVIDAGFALHELEFVDGGRRIAVAGEDGQIPLFYLGSDLGALPLQARLIEASQLCLSPEQRVRFVGESQERAAAASAACEAGSLLRLGHAKR